VLGRTHRPSGVVEGSLGPFSIPRLSLGTFNKSGLAGELIWHSAMRSEVARSLGDKDRQTG
jgi:hypothetical protein